MSSTLLTAPDFDDAPLADIEQALPRDEFVAFVREYLDSAAQRLRHAEALYGGGDIAGLRAEAHTIISTAGSYGLRGASMLAREIEAACKKGELGVLPGLMAELAAASQRGWSKMSARFLQGA